jgi:two-component system sensor histidine kinase YesM
LNINKELQRKLEIQMLQSQINPHFLYNTLGSISNVVHLGQLDKVDPVIRSLIAILEYGIKDSSEKVTLRDELRNVRDYLQIQNIRYNKQFEWVEAIGPEHGNYPVFRMMLQPIVENSIFHGYEGGTISGPIYLATYEENRRFIVEVRDAGVGMPQPIVDRLLTAQSDESRPGRKRIGLYNIHARIRLQYGEPYGIRVSSTEGAGTTVRLELPIQACGSE